MWQMKAHVVIRTDRLSRPATKQCGQGWGMMWTVCTCRLLPYWTHTHTTAVQNRTSLSQACVRRLHKIVFNRWIWVWLEQVLTNVIFVVRVISVIYGCMVHWLVCWMGCALKGGWGTGYQYCPRSLSVWMLSNMFTDSLTYFVPAHGTLKSDWLSFTQFI